MSSYSADAIRRSYIDEAVKAALLGASPGTSFGLPMSTVTTFAASALAAGPVVLVPAVGGKMIIPLSALVGTDDQLQADISANIGWPAPNPDEPGDHDEPWLAAAVPFWYADELGSLVMLPNATATPVGRLWPECVFDRPLAVKASAPPATRGAKKGKKHVAKNGDGEAHAEAHAEGDEEEGPEPELTIVVFYTVF